MKKSRKKRDKLPFRIPIPRPGCFMRDKSKYTRKKKVAKPAEDKPKMMNVRTKKGFPINLRFVNIMVHPGTVQPVPDHPYVQRQIQLGSIEVVED